MTNNIDNIIGKMTLEEKAGQMLYAGVLENENNWPDEDTKKIIQKGLVGALRIYGSRYEPFACAEFSNQLQRWADKTRLGIPVLVGADFEGGASMARYGITRFPLQMALGAAAFEELAEEVSRIIARESRALGVHMNHRPVADVNNNPENPIIGIRAYGSDPDNVSALVEAAIRGAEKEGLLTIVKHYPGHGDTNTDSHLQMTSVDFNEEIFRQIHLKPFLKAKEAGMSGVMTAHIIINCIDSEYPATLSSKIMTEILRNEAGFDGLLITDSMNMRGITKKYDIEEAAVRAVQAGIDLILSTGSPEDQLRRRNSIVNAVKTEILSEKRVNASVKRILNAKKKAGILDNAEVDPVKALKICGKKEHRQLSYKCSLKGLTVLKNEGELLPFKKDTRILVTGVRDVRLLGEEISLHRERVIVHELPSSKFKRKRKTINSVDTPMSNLENYKEKIKKWQPTAAELETVKDLVENIDIAVMTTYGHNNTLFSGQKKLISEIKLTGTKVILISIGAPIQKEDLKDCSFCIIPYVREELHPEVIQALTNVFVGLEEARGQLPM